MIIEDEEEFPDPPQIPNCRCVLIMYERPWLDDLEATMNLHFGTTSPRIPEFQRDA